MAQWPIKAKRSYQVPGTGVTGGYETPCGCWESKSNPGPHEEQQCSPAPAPGL